MGQYDAVPTTFSRNQPLPPGYRVFWMDGLYYWENDKGDCGGECWDRFAVRRMAIKHADLQKSK